MSNGKQQQRILNGIKLEITKENKTGPRVAPPLFEHLKLVITTTLLLMHAIHLSPCVISYLLLHILIKFSFLFPLSCCRWTNQGPKTHPRYLALTFFWMKPSDDVPWPMKLSCHHRRVIARRERPWSSAIRQCKHQITSSFWKLAKSRWRKPCKTTGTKENYSWR